MEAENKRLKDVLRVAIERYKKMWQLTCEQSREQEELLAAQQEEIESLKRRSAVLTRTPTPTGHQAHSYRECERAPSDDKFSLSEHSSSVKRRGKASPVDSFTGEDPEVRIDDWLPALKRAGSWNGWSEAETLIQVAGPLRG